MILETYLRDILAPKDNLSIQDIAFANALAETYHESALTRRLTSREIIHSEPEPINSHVPRHDLARKLTDSLTDSEDNQDMEQRSYKFKKSKIVEGGQ